MRPLARVHAITDARILAKDDLGVRAAAIAAGGPGVALHARHRGADGAALSRIAARFVALAAPPEASVLVAGRPDIAAAVRAQGVQLADGDLAPADARRVQPDGLVGRSVHSADEAARARDEGADFVLLGHVFETPSHPGRAALGLDELGRAVRAGLPVIAIGGIDAARARQAREAGAWGVAAIRALWDADDPYAATRALLEPWTEA